MFVLAAIAAIILLAFVKLLWVSIDHHVWLPIAKRQFPAMIGVPLCGIIALIVISIARVVSTPTAIKIGAAEINEMAAFVILWLCCFLVLVIAMRLAWMSGLTFPPYAP